MPKHMTMGTLSRNPFIASRMSVLVSLKNYMLALQLPLTIIKFEAIICLLIKGEKKNPKSKNRTKKPKDPIRFFYKI